MPTLRVTIEIDLDVEYRTSPAERQTESYPGCDEDIDIWGYTPQIPDEKKEEIRELIREDLAEQAIIKEEDRAESRRDWDREAG